jgi:hypothetical protein
MYLHTFFRISLNFNKKLFFKNFFFAISTFLIKEMRKKDVYVVILNSKFKEDDESEDIQVNWRVQNKYLGVLNFNFRKMIMKRMRD